MSDRHKLGLVVKSEVKRVSSMRLNRVCLCSLSIATISPNPVILLH